MSRYEYSCNNCSGPVKKNPVGMIPQKKGEPTVSGLHGWSCNSCGKGMKVTRKLN